MQSLWSDADAERLVARYAGQGIGRDLALRVYTSRLLGGEPRARAARRRQHFGQDRAPGSLRRGCRSAVRQGQRLGHGGDRARRPAGGPPRAAAHACARARRCRTRRWCACQRANLIDPGAPNPSVETLLHAFLPHKFIDHTHATAVLSLADQPDAAERCADLYGGRLGHRALHHARLSARQEGRRGLRGRSRRSRGSCC